MRGPRGLLPKLLIGVAAACIAMALSVVDTLNDQQLSVSLLYIALVALVTWFDTPRTGAFLCVVVSVALLLDAAIFREAEGARAIYYWNALLTIAAAALAWWLITRIKSAMAGVRELAWVDELTGLFRRRAFLQILSSEVDRCRRYHRPFALALVDVHDVRGGQRDTRALLHTVSGTLRQNLRSTDAIGRLDDHLFSVLMPETADASAAAVLERLQRALRAAVERQGWTATFTLVAVAFSTSASSATEALQAAEDLLRAARAEGDGQIRIGGWSTPAPVS